jgi:hypothetical protein
MCNYREHAIKAYASGSASAEDERVARVHLAACAPCRDSYAQLVREMRSRAFQRDAAAAFLPAPVLPLGHHLGLLGRMIGWTGDRPRVGTARAAELLGGAGVVKVAAAGSAIVVATATLANGIHTSLVHHPSPHHRRAQTAALRPAGHPIVTPASSASASAAPRASGTITRAQTPTHLTSREHAELEFSSLRSARSSTSPQTSERPTASTAAVHESSTSSGSSEGEQSQPSAGSHSPTSNGASQAAREFGQP